jgi:SAM-dependent methyltransferase
LQREEDTVGYWNKKWRLREQKLKEHSSLDGSDGEREFDADVLRRARGKEVLDIGCGPGEFTLRVAKKAKLVVGVDPSSVALRLARENLRKSGLRNASFRKGVAEDLPFANGAFDLAYSRRGPASDDRHNLAQALRVLRQGGAFMEISIGERDKENIAEIFGRGQMLGFQGKVSAVKSRWLREVGFGDVVARDYMATEVFHTIDDLIVRLMTAPIIPSFDVKRDGRFLERVEEQCSTERGIESPVHRVVLTARK